MISAIMEKRVKNINNIQEKYIGVKMMIFG